MKNKLWVCSPLFLSLVFSCKTPTPVAQQDSFPQRDFVSNPSPAVLSPEESMKTIRVPQGYHLELVASEPMVKEPVAIAWDGNGRMFVAEMITYMKDVNGTGKDEPVSRISMLEDTNGDGKMDKSSVFIDKLVLPRMILPLDDRLIVNETYNNYLWSYRDTNGDGVADEKKLVYKNDLKDTRNLEHQKSGLVWNLDNWMYVSRDPIRYRYQDGMIKDDSMGEGASGQWGLGNDNYGRLFFSNAGGEVPAIDFQQNPAYGKLNFQDQFNPSFQETWPIVANPDVQGGLKRMRENQTLNHFTASNGPSIFRGDRLPEDMRGDLFICEPVGRLIRRAKVINKEGKLYLENAYDKQEFLASSDMNFRPVNTANGPDGCLYVVDMYRGIIQESNWTKEGSFIRKAILERGLDKNIDRGRIYRLVHDNFKPDTKKPALLKASNEELVAYLNHPNGWWRDNAQKLLIIRNDKAVVPALKKLALGEQTFLEKLAFWSAKPNHLARIHALWTLEGLQEADKNTVANALKDEHPQVLRTAVWVSENYIKKNDGEIINQVASLKNDVNADVKIQLAASLRYSSSEVAKNTIKDMLAQNPTNQMLVESQKSFDKNIQTIATRKANLNKMAAADKALLEKGAVAFKQVCATCHGPDGKGLAIGGTTMAAPPLAGSKRINGDKDAVIRILLHGLAGPIDGKTYPDAMPAMGGNDDEWIASVASYIRNDLGNKASVVKPEDVKQIRTATAGRVKNWTLQEMEMAKK